MRTYQRNREIAAKYQPYLKRYAHDARAKVAYERYGTRSNLHRGYYCPSLIEDLVVGNTHRGRLLKNKPLNKPQYTYGFDENDNLILANSPWSKEIIVREGTEIGITISDGEIQELSECIYEDGRIKSYALSLFNPDGRIMDLKEERYWYLADELRVEESRVAHGMGHKQIREFACYTFPIIDGYIDSYTIQYYSEDGSEKPSVWDGRVFSGKKRRIL